MEKKAKGSLMALFYAGLALLFLPMILSAVFGQVALVVDAATASLEGVAPKLAALLFVVVAIALSLGGMLHAFGHGRGKTMIRGSIEAAIFATLGGAFFVWLGHQGPTVATDLVTNIANRIPGL